MKSNSVLLIALIMGSFSAAVHAERLLCESEDERFRECPVSSGEVRLVRQLSKAECVEGRTWAAVRAGSMLTMVAVPNLKSGTGTTALQAISSGLSANPRMSRRQECHTGPGEIRLLRQLSKSLCVEHRTWGRTAHGIYVDDGCRGEFEVRDEGGRDRSGDHGGPRTQHLTCQSEDGRRMECASGPGRVRLLRQLSKTACLEYSNWGRTSRGIYVDDGCRAEFEVTDYRGR